MAEPALPPAPLSVRCGARTVPAWPVATWVIGARYNDAVFVLAARTCRDGRIWERLVLSSRDAARRVVGVDAGRGAHAADAVQRGLRPVRRPLAVDTSR